MTLPVNLTDKLNTPVDTVIVGQITTVNDWGYGLSTEKLIMPGSVTAVSLHNTEADANSGLNGTTVDINTNLVTTVPGDGQFRINYDNLTGKIGFAEANSAQNEKWLRITCQTYGDLWGSKKANAVHGKLNKIPDPVGAYAGKVLSPKADGTSYELITQTGGGSGIPTRAVAYSTQPLIGYFYDDMIAATTAKWIGGHVGDINGTLIGYWGAGVHAPNVSSTHYGYGNITTGMSVSGVARSIGWHKVEFRPQTGETLIDDILVNTHATARTLLSIRLFGNKDDPCYFDDITCEDFASEGFEYSTIDFSRWWEANVSSQFAVSTTQKRSGSKSLFASAKPTGSGYVGAAYQFNTKGQPVSISAVTPANNATAIATNSAIEVTFNEDMDFNTSPLNFKVFSNAEHTSEIAGTISQIGPHKWRFTPSSNLPVASTIYPCIKTSARSKAGLYLQAQYDWSFTTA